MCILKKENVFTEATEHKESTNEKCIACISPTTPVYFMQLNSNVNGDVFADFINGLSYPKGTNVVMDNASIHKTEKVLKTIQEKGYNVHFIPPYSPDFNPIKNVFGIIK